MSCYIRQDNHAVMIRLLNLVALSEQCTCKLSLLLFSFVDRDDQHDWNVSFLMSCCGLNLLFFATKQPIPVTFFMKLSKTINCPEFHANFLGATVTRKAVKQVFNVMWNKTSFTEIWKIHSAQSFWLFELVCSNVTFSKKLP